MLLQDHCDVPDDVYVSHGLQNASKHSYDRVQLLNQRDTFTASTLSK